VVNMPLKQWVETALSVQDYALKASPWLDTARFDLDARLPSRQQADQKAPTNQNPIPEMMKALLVERFALKWHEELQNVSGFELVPGKKVLAQPATLVATVRHSCIQFRSYPYQWNEHVDVRACRGIAKGTRKASYRRNTSSRWIRSEIDVASR
jgi:hypothetical protein